jgi:hypothetical protein
VKAYDPVAMKEAQHILGDRIEYGKDEYETLIDADALLLVTEWPEFRSPNFAVVNKLRRRRCLRRPQHLRRQGDGGEGFAYFGIGVKQATVPQQTKPPYSHGMKKSIGHGRRRLPRLPPVRPLHPRRLSRHRMDNLITGNLRTSSTCSN